MLARPGGGHGGFQDRPLLRPDAQGLPPLRSARLAAVGGRGGVAGVARGDRPGGEGARRMHWLRWPDRLSGAEDIFAFDVKTETWRLIGLPPEATEKRWARKKVAAVEGKLCLVVMVDEEVEVWVLASYRQDRYDFLRGEIAEAPVRHKCIQQVFKFESDLVPCEEIDERPDLAFKWDCKP
uniref:F-box associated domain-containing protein n=1 Tax=Oryza punctata TaxID=4537 RepID=A0A0E0LXP8_ORYPU